MRKKTTIIALFLCSLLYAQDIKVGSENFTKIVHLIEREGSPILSDGVPIYMIYSFVDSHGNFHKVRMGNTKYTIMIDSFYKGVLRQKNFFDWEISIEKVNPFIIEDGYINLNIPAVKFAYEELLQKAT